MNEHEASHVLEMHSQRILCQSYEELKLNKFEYNNAHVHV